MNVFLIDGTYELFRHFYAVPNFTNAAGQEVGAVRGVVRSVLSMLEDRVTHIGVATDHVVESFRNKMWPGYKSGEGIDPVLMSQFPLLEQALTAMGVQVWPMIEFEADDGLASGAAKAASNPEVEQVFICTPDKDLAQSVVGTRVVQFDRRLAEVRDASAVKVKYGVGPDSIPDYLALTGDTADGYPGLPGWGAKSSSLVLARYGDIESIPDSVDVWDVKVRGAAKLAATLAKNRELALTFRDLATLRTDAPVFDTVDELKWGGPREDFIDYCTQMDAQAIYRRVERLAIQRSE
jgi:5'-3' exonuclease